MRKRTLLIGFAALCLSMAPEAGAQVNFGGQVSFADDQDLGLGARLLVDVSSLKSVEFIGTFDYFFPSAPLGSDRDYWELNGNLAYSFDIKQASSLSPYVGGGLNIAHGSREFDDGRNPSGTDLGINLLAGTHFGSAPVRPFAELRVELAGGEQFVISGGILFF